MEQFELDLIEKHMSQDMELKSLWDLHLDYERRLEKLAGKPFLSPPKKRM